MTLAEKIANLRKKNRWSQEELAEKMGVSRQAVSKWESAQAAPDLEKVLALSRLFGVTTDYPLKDELETEELAADGDGEPAKRVSLALASEFLAWRKRAARRMAAATLLCVVAVIPLLLLSAATKAPRGTIPEKLAAGAGLAALLVLVAAAVALFVSCGLRGAPFAFLDREPFETEYGVDEMVRERQSAYRPAYVKSNIAAACLCVLSPIPLFAGLLTETEKEYLIVGMLSVTILLAGVGAALFVLAGARWAGMRKLLREGEYAPGDRRKVRVKKTVSTIYWLTATAVYLAWSVWTGAWETTWILWPVAGILFALAIRLRDLFLERK